MTRHENGPRKPTQRKPESRKPIKSEPASRPAERQRIAKLMARVGLCSRRDAEAWIIDGRVTLNGELLTSPAQDVGPDDTILVDGMPLPDAEKTRLFLFHKPRGLVTSDHDPEGRETVADFLHENWPDGPRVVTIGRLDINTEGLLLLTNDGGLARVLELPQTGWVRRYRVRAKGETDQGVLDRLRDGVTIEGVDYAGIEAKLDRIQGANCWLTMGLREGKNREIKRVLEHIGLEVNRLIRLSFGPFQLLDLPEGKVEEVKTRILRDQLGEGLAAAAGVDFQDADIAAPEIFIPETKILTARDVAIARKRAEHTSGDRRTSEMKGRKTFGVKAPAGKMRENAEEQEPRRERPVAGTRKHVSTLRADEAAGLRKGPRKRIERGDTKDRKDRTVAVERLIASHPEPRARRGAGRFATDEHGARKPRQERGAREPRQERGAREPRQERGRDHASPSAMAKRVRVARSGGEAPEPRGRGAAGFGAERPRRDDRGERPFAAGPTGGKQRSLRPQTDAPPREERPARAPRKEFGDRSRARPARDEASAKPGRKDFGDRSRAREGSRADATDRPSGASRRVGERNAGERDARKFGDKRPSSGRGFDKRSGGGKPGVRVPGGDRSGPKGPSKGPARGPRASKPKR